LPEIAALINARAASLTKSSASCLYPSASLFFLSYASYAVYLDALYSSNIFSSSSFSASSFSASVSLVVDFLASSSASSSASAAA